MDDPYFFLEFSWEQTFFLFTENQTTVHQFHDTDGSDM